MRGWERDDDSHLGRLRLAVGVGFLQEFAVDATGGHVPGTRLGVAEALLDDHRASRGRRRVTGLLTILGLGRLPKPGAAARGLCALVGFEQTVKRRVNFFPEMNSQLSTSSANMRGRTESYGVVVCVMNVANALPTEPPADPARRAASPRSDGDRGQRRVPRRASASASASAEGVGVPRGGYRAGHVAPPGGGGFDRRREGWGVAPTAHVDP